MAVDILLTSKDFLSQQSQYLGHKLHQVNIFFNHVELKLFTKGQHISTLKEICGFLRRDRSQWLRSTHTKVKDLIQIFPRNFPLLYNFYR